MPGFGGKGIQLDNKRRRELFHLLSGQASTPSSAWRAFWQPIFDSVDYTEGNDAEILASVFEEGLSLISARGSGSSSLVSRWVKEVAAAAEQHGKAWGCPAASVEQVQQLRDSGAQLIAHGSEFSAMVEHLKQSADHLDQVYGPRV